MPLGNACLLLEFFADFSFRVGDFGVFFGVVCACSVVVFLTFVCFVVI